MEIIINNKPYNFIAKASIGALYRYEKIFGHPYTQQEGAVAPLVELYYAYLVNDNPEDYPAYDEYMAEIDTLFPTLVKVHTAAQAAAAPQNQQSSAGSEEQKKTENP